jgi:hypothetical protein
MKVLAITCEHVEFMRGDMREIEYAPVDEFVSAHGWEALYGRPKSVTEYEDGTLYEF